MRRKTYYLEPSHHIYEHGKTYKTQEYKYFAEEFTIEPRIDSLYIYISSHDIEPLPRLYKTNLLKGVKHHTPWYNKEGYYSAKKFKIIGEVDYKQLYNENLDNIYLFILTIAYDEQFRNHYLQVAKEHPEEIYKLDDTTKKLLARLNYKEFNDCLMNDPDINSPRAVAEVAVHFNDEHYLDRLIDYNDIDIKYTFLNLNTKKYIDKLIATEDEYICYRITRKIYGDDYELTQEERIKYLDVLVKSYNNDTQTYVLLSALKYNLPQYIEFYLANETYPNIYYRIIETGNLDYIKRLTNSPIESVAKVAQDKLNELTTK